MGTRPSAAVVLYPWCVQYGSIASGTLNCGFTSFKQCQADRFRQRFELHPKSAVSELSAITALRTSHSSVTAGTAANKKGLGWRAHGYTRPSPTSTPGRAFTNRLCPYQLAGEEKNLISVHILP